MDIRWIWTLGLVSLLALSARGTSDTDKLVYTTVPGAWVEVVPLHRQRRYVAGEEEGVPELSLPPTSGPQYNQPLSSPEGQASRYKTTAASGPVAPVPTSANVTSANETSSAVAAGPAPAATSNSSEAAVSPTAATATTTTANASHPAVAASEGPTTAQLPASTVPQVVQPTAAAPGPSGDVAAVVTEVDTDQDPERYPQIFTNQTFRNHNITQSDEDHHLYYNSTMVNDEVLAQRLWVDTANQEGVFVNPMLSQSHRRASTVRLSFDFPFYGHLVRNVTVATGGFIYMGDFIHSWLAATQYVAPLMANFDTSISEHSYVKYLDNGTAFTVQWDNVHLQDSSDVGGFSFQLTLKNTGDIIFVYHVVPLPVESIADLHHPVKVGISDAYIIDRNIFFLRRKTIYEYHRVSFSHQDIQNGTVIYLSALPTCLSARDCASCLTAVTNFQCQWCKGRCSDGMDRRRQEWLQMGCDKQGIADVEQCPPPPSRNQQALPAQQPLPTVQPHGEAEAAAERGAAPSAEAARSEQRHAVAELHVTDSSESSVSVSGVVAILSVVTLICATGVWILYAYRNPHTASGQFLIRYRPSQWSWRRGEARYTAATIHM